jgi:hypothetical protein
MPDFPRIYRIRSTIRYGLQIAFSVLVAVGLVLYYLLKFGPMAPSPPHPNYLGLACSAIVCFELVILLLLRYRVTLELDRIEARFFFTSCLRRDQISGWRSRFPEGRGDIRVYPRDKHKSAVLIMSEAERDETLLDWIKGFSSL